MKQRSPDSNWCVYGLHNVEREVEETHTGPAPGSEERHVVFQHHRVLLREWMPVIR